MFSVLERQNDTASGNELYDSRKGKGRSQISQSIRMKVIELRKKGYRLQEISTMLGLSISAAWQCIRKFKNAGSPEGAHKKANGDKLIESRKGISGKKIAQSIRMKVIELRKKGYRLREISTMLGLSISAAWQFIRCAEEPSMISPMKTRSNVSAILPSCKDENLRKFHTIDFDQDVFKSKSILASGKTLNESIKIKVIELRKKGYTLGQVSTMIGVSRDTASRIIKYYNAGSLEGPYQRGKVTDVEKEPLMCRSELLLDNVNLPSSIATSISLNDEKTVDFEKTKIIEYSEDNGNQYIANSDLKFQPSNGRFMSLKIEKLNINSDDLSNYKFNVNHTNFMNRYQCHICNYVCTSRYSLSQHDKIHKNKTALDVKKNDNERFICKVEEIELSSFLTDGPLSSDDDTISYDFDSVSYDDDTGSFDDDTESFDDDTQLFEDGTESFDDDTGSFDDNTVSHDDDISVQHQTFFCAVCWQGYDRTSKLIKHCLEMHGDMIDYDCDNSSKLMS